MVVLDSGYNASQLAQADLDVDCWSASLGIACSSAPQAGIGAVGRHGCMAPVCLRDARTQRGPLARLPPSTRSMVTCGWTLGPSSTCVPPSDQPYRRARPGRAGAGQAAAAPAAVAGLARWSAPSRPAPALAVVRAQVRRRAAFGSSSRPWLDNGSPTPSRGGRSLDLAVGRRALATVARAILGQ